MGDVDERAAEFPVHALQFHLHGFTQIGVERSQGLVEQHHLRLRRERAGKRDPLLLTAGELMRHLPGLFAEMHHVQKASDATHRSPALAKRARAIRSRNPNATFS